MKFLREYIEERGNLKGVKVLIRLDLNVPVAKGRVVNDFRIRSILPTLTMLKNAGARTIIISHIETVAADGGPTLAPVAAYMKTLGISATFVAKYAGALGAIEKMQDGNIIILENLRVNEGEKKNDAGFAKELASLADIYVNDAFAVSHREHASLCAVTQFLPSFAGPLLEQEIKNLSSAFNPDPLTGRPFLFILAGAKFETKMPLIEKFMTIADKAFIGGALSNDFFKAKGIEVGKSKLSAKPFDLSRFMASSKLLLPVDVVTVTDVARASGGQGMIKSLSAITPADTIMDSGPETVRMLGEQIASAKYILWNGPLGAYEQGFKQPTLSLARMIAAATARGAHTVVGGGDTVATIADLGIEDKFSFVSTGGGAMLDFLAKGTLAAIEALERANN